jgi:hypothetical protein
MGGKSRMSMTLTCASNFECWTFVAEAIANCGVAAELRCKLKVGGYRVRLNHHQRNTFTLGL